MATTLPPAGRNQSPDDHMRISRRFVEHAREELAKGERLQASQKIYGVAQHALAAVGKERGWNTDDYSSKEFIAYYLAEEFNNPMIRLYHDSFKGYHVNFYQNDIADEGAIKDTIDDAEAFLDEMQRIRENGPQPYTVTNKYQIDRIRRITGRTVEEGVTYSDGFVNAGRLRRYQRQWAERREIPNNEDDENDAGD